MPNPLRIFLVGRTSGELDVLRDRSAADGAVEIAGSALLHDITAGTARLPDSIDAIVVTPAAWPVPAKAVGHAQEATPATGGRAERLVEELTPRERDVLGLVADGRPNREIATRLGVSEHTVKFHLASIFGKLGVTTRTQAVRRALEWGLVEI